MLNFIDNYLLTPYVQGVLFIILLGLFWLQHRKFKLVSSGFNWLRTILLMVIFLYFYWNFTTSISPLIVRISILGMFFINLHMLYNLMLGNLDEKYRLALETYGQDIANKGLQEDVWGAGKKYIYTRYFFDALFSGYSPRNFLKGVISRQVPADIQSVFAKLGVSKELVTNQKLLAFLAMKLNQSPELPQEVKDILAQVIKQFGDHAWIQEQVDEFLQLALKDPEKFYEATWNGNPPEAK
jgi:hypothetical protein